jgi:LemA protein
MALLLIIVLALVVIFAALFVLLTYNNLIAKRNRVQDAWAQIEVQLKRRYDLIPNLVEAVKGYMKYEKSVLTQVTKLRASIVTGSVQDRAAADNMISQSLKSIFAVAENYPDLKASENFKNLQDELEDTEDKISFVRTSYNDYVLDYNNTIQQFPGNMFAGSMHMQKQDYFQVPQAEEANVQQPVKVNFDDVNNDQSTAAQQSAAAPAKGTKKAPQPKKPKKPKAAPSSQ